MLNNWTPFFLVLLMVVVVVVGGGGGFNLNSTEGLTSCKRSH